MRQLAPSLLWIGHAGDARDVRRLLDLGIEAVIDLAENEPPLVLPRELVCCRFPLTDSDGNPAWVIRAAVQTVAELLRLRVRTLVCCSAGMSRSPAIAAAGLAKFTGTSPAECLRTVANARPIDVSPGLWHDIEAMLRGESPGSAG